jgi:hypothetical protein
LLAALDLAMSDFLDPGGGPDSSGDFRVSPSAFLALLGVGFLVGTLGHIVKSRALVALGVTLVFGATVLLPFAYTLAR